MIASDEYRQQARRLRQRYAGRPGMLQYSLAELSRRHDKAHRSEPGRVATVVPPARDRTSGPTGPTRPGSESDPQFHPKRTAGPITHLVEDQNHDAFAANKVTAVQARPGIKNGPDAAFARAVVDWYSDQVAGQLSGDLLHHSQRQELLKTAERLGIGRFHANLIFAMAQHEAQSKPRNSWRIMPKTRRNSLSAFAIFVIAQAAIIWAGWSLLHFS